MRDFETILSKYPQLTLQSAIPLGNAGGFSGARIWKLTTKDSQVFCLRQWPQAHPTHSQLDWHHRVLRHVHSAGLTCVPVPIHNQDGSTICPSRETSQGGGPFWEVSPWMPGQADFRSTVDSTSVVEKLTSAMQTLQRWHSATSTFEPTSTVASAPGIQMRQKRYQATCHGGLTRLEQAIARARTERPTLLQLATVSHEIISAFKEIPDRSQELSRACQISVTLQPCIRDIWHDHVLFTNNRVTGLIDFGAMRTATIAGDIARLLGSLAQDNQQLWQLGREAYFQAAPRLNSKNTDDLWQLVRIWDRANVLLSGLQWIEWLYVERREFPDESSLETRLQSNLCRLRNLKISELL